jgi:hypothetical protein
MSGEKRPPGLPFYVPMPEGTPIETTELDWRQAARDDGWELVDDWPDPSPQIWVHPDHSTAYEDGPWVYVGGGQWEDAQVMTWTPEQRREMNARYLKLVQDTAAAIADETTHHRGGDQGEEQQR